MVKKIKENMRKGELLNRRFLSSVFQGSKGIGPVVATALLLIVAVVAVIGFQGWFTGYQSTLNTQVESRGGETFNTGIETMIGNTIFIKNNYDNLSILSVKVDGVDCNLTTSIISGMRPLNISGCIDYDNLTTDTPEIVVVTDKGIMSKYVYVKDANVVYSLISTLTGQFIDNAVEGLTYSTSTQNGNTNSNGEFLYMSGEMISFYVSDVYLGTTTAKPIITLADLGGGIDSQYTVNLARFLQSSDNDGDLNNGINISQQVLDNSIGQSINFSLSNNEFETNVSSIVSPLISAQLAKDHLTSSIEALENGIGLSITTNLSSIDYDGVIKLTWSSSNANTCVGSGSWSGSKTLSGEIVVSSIRNNLNYVLECSNAETSISKNVSIVIGEQDTMPNSFSFTNVTNANFSVEILSNEVVVSGFQGPINASISGDGSSQLRINSGSWVTFAQNIEPEDTIQIKLTSVNDYDTSRSAVLTLGDYSTTWSVTTRISTSLSCTTDADGNGFISYLCGNYPMTITTLEGHLDPVDNVNSVRPNVNCVFSDDKSSCVNNFVVNGCGTGTVLDTGSGLCWQQNFGTAGTRTWENAKTYCNGLSLGGKTDWYLPSYNELLTIVDLSRSSPAIVGGNSNKFTNVVSNWYWTKTTYGANTASAWFVHFNDGNSGYGARTSSYYVACVRRH